jgi:hypothetical protein
LLLVLFKTGLLVSESLFLKSLLFSADLLFNASPLFSSCLPFYTSLLFNASMAFGASPLFIMGLLFSAGPFFRTSLLFGAGLFGCLGLSLQLRLLELFKVFLVVDVAATLTLRKAARAPLKLAFDIHKVNHFFGVSSPAALVVKLFSQIFQGFGIQVRQRGGASDLLDFDGSRALRKSQSFGRGGFCGIARFHF